MDSKRRRFTNFQWYLAHARNNVHFAALLPEKLSKQAATNMIAAAFRHQPQLTDREDLTRNEHQPSDDVSPDDILEYTDNDSFDETLRDWMLPRSEMFADKSTPACRAWCVAADQANEAGSRSLIVMQSTHALAEGADLSTFMRDRDARPERAVGPDYGLSWLGRMTISAVAPLLAVIHYAQFLGEKRRREDYRFVSLALDRNAVSNVMASMALNSRSFLFSLVLYSIVQPAKKRNKISFAYSTLPRTKFRMADDAHLKLRMQIMNFAADGDFPSYAQAFGAAVEKLNVEEMVTQTIFEKALNFHRMVHSAFPKLYNKRFFGYGPQDIVLSLLPPIRPAGVFAPLADVPVYGGSNTGTVPNCLFLVCPKHITLNFWASPDHQAKIPELRKLLAELEIPVLDQMD